MDAQVAVQATISIAAIGILIMSLEDIAVLRLFQSNGILSWDVMKLQDPWSMKGLTGKLADFFLDYAHFKLLILARSMAAVMLLLFQTNRVVFLLGSLIILGSLLALSFRSIYGLDGAHQMYVVIFGAFFLGGLAGDESLGKTVSIWFVGLQAGLAYFISGVNKLVSPMWRSGDALIGVLGTDTYGHRQAYAVLSKHISLARLLSWLVIFFECGFCVVFLVDPGIGLWILLGGVSFHLVNALLMGLNGFLTAFVACYPCVAYCALHTPCFFPIVC